MSSVTTNDHANGTNGTNGISKPKESNVDVLIVGAGPAGLMAAAWMAHCGINARIVDKRNAKIFTGQADGITCRTIEIFDSLGFADRVWKEALHLQEISMWNPNAEGVIHRSDRIPDTVIGVSRFQQCVLNQGRIERWFIDNIKKYSNDTISVERGVLPESLVIDESKVEDDDAYPVTVTLRTLTEEEATPVQAATASKSVVSDGLFRSNLMQEDDEADLLRKTQTRPGTEEIVHAKYVIGCDGARSWTRRALGLELEGEATDYIWGVMDIIPITDFPDIRNRCAVHSAENGSLMVIPRENRMVRLYIQLKEVVPDASGRADRSKITPDLIFRAAQKIIAPYKLDYEYCDWWTAYQIGQRIGNSFDVHNRVFLAGDAVHTHSPKAGQGMNVSMQDTFNLGWKVALVTKGICKRDILATYQSERRRIAQDLIEFDHKFSRLFSGRPAKDMMDAEGIDMEEFKRAFMRGNMFASGMQVDYGPSNLVVKAGDWCEQGDRSEKSAKLLTEAKISDEKFSKKQALATEIPVGKRLASFKVLSQADARPWHIQERLKADGRFRIVLFAGNILSAQQKARVDKFCAKLDAPESFLQRITPADKAIDSVIDILTIHSSPRRDTELLRDFPDILHPFDHHLGWDYTKVYADDVSYHEGFGDAYKNYGVDKERGCVVVVRPDQYVAYVGDIDDFEDLENYFEGCLRLPAVGVAQDISIVTETVSSVTSKVAGEVKLAVRAGICHMRRWIIGAYILLPLTYLACLCVAFTKCIPFSKQWQINPDPGNNCKPAVSVLQTVFVMIMNTATDFYLMGIPLPMIWKSNLPWSNKLVLLVMFSGGFIEMAFGILRCVSILTVGNTDPAQSGYWSVRESFVSFVLTNLPMIYPLFKRLVDHVVYSLTDWSRKDDTATDNHNTNNTSFKSNGFMLNPQEYPYPIDSPMFNPIRSGASRGTNGRPGAMPDPIFSIHDGDLGDFWGSTTSEDNTIGTSTGQGSDPDDVSRQTLHATVGSQSGTKSYRSNCNSPTQSRNDCGRKMTTQTPHFKMVTSVESSGMIADQPHRGLCSGDSSSSTGNGTAQSAKGIVVTREVTVMEEGVCWPDTPGLSPGLPPTELWEWGDFHMGY
ncbi:FAD binding domain-containing protein [Sordaria sp. MPI-SDFR-AT-0083]|nr:FAD binding domain-containing protein [Sordaria sp. MPI-SDFR-AT-0083]